MSRIPDDEHDEILELIHLRVGTMPTLHIVGTYLESSPTIDEAFRAEVRLEAKNTSVEEKSAYELVI